MKSGSQHQGSQGIGRPCQLVGARGCGNAHTVLARNVESGQGRNVGKQSVMDLHEGTSFDLGWSTREQVQTNLEATGLWISANFRIIPWQQIEFVAIGMERHLFFHRFQERLPERRPFRAAEAPVAIAVQKQLLVFGSVVEKREAQGEIDIRGARFEGNIVPNKRGQVRMGHSAPRKDYRRQCENE